jgi:hypothetical protein
LLVTYTFVCTHVYMYVCMYVCKCGRAYARMHVCTYFHLFSFSIDVQYTFMVSDWENPVLFLAEAVCEMCNWWQNLAAGSDVGEKNFQLHYDADWC